ncbi:MAG: heme biosynthesis protein HemY [Alphaproteobacteria bacterium]|nr:MAG: heme biosynthesis protein HemY [Alphaproteobacteria bacterium]
MIWSLLKIVVFIALGAAIAFGASLVIETPGHVDIAFGGREIQLRPLDFIVLVALLFVALYLLLKLAGLLVAILRWMQGDEVAISRYLNRNREKRGYDALTEGMIALASGDGREALVRANRAAKLLKRPALTGLLSAQAAALAGNAAEAEAQYRKLLGEERTRFVGVLGLMRRRLAEGRKDVALKLAEKAFELKPAHPEVLDTLFALQSEAGDWAGCRRTLQAKVRARLLPRDVGVRRDAVLSLAEARAAEMEGEIGKARKAAYEAVRQAPDLVPAAVTAARLKMQEGQRRDAERILRKAWEAAPHPEIAAAYAALEPDETPQERLARFRPLLTTNADHPETRMLAAELALAAEDFPAARRALGDLAETRPTARSLALMAAIERGAGASEAVVRGFLARALTASRGEQWVCSKCRHIHAGWTPICENCGAFDTLSWEEAPQQEAPGLVAAATLPLLAGGEEEIEAEPEPEAVDVEIDAGAEAEAPEAEESPRAASGAEGRAA